MNSAPTFHEVELFVRDFAGLRPGTRLMPSTRLDADLGITGDDGDELLKAASKHFSVALADPVHGYRATFGLGQDEHLFHDEGLDLLGAGAFIRWLTGASRVRVRDVTVQALHEAILRSKAAGALPGSFVDRAVEP